MIVLKRLTTNIICLPLLKLHITNSLIIFLFVNVCITNLFDHTFLLLTLISYSYIEVSPVAFPIIAIDPSDLVVLPLSEPLVLFVARQWFLQYIRTILFIL